MLEQLHATQQQWIVEAHRMTEGLCREDNASNEGHGAPNQKKIKSDTDGGGGACLWT